MLIRLTKMGSSILVNFNQVTNCEVMQTAQGRLTKIWMLGGAYVNVEESLEDIMKLQLDYVNGNYQDTTCAIQPIQNRMEDSYQAQVRRPRRNYSNNELFNNKEW